MSEKATQGQEKAPEVIVKKAPAKPKAKQEPKVDLTDLKRVSAEVQRLEGLKADRLALIQKAAKAGATTQAISEATSLSVPRLRQLIHK
jgi:hypothetical protein